MVVNSGGWQAVKGAPFTRNTGMVVAVIAVVVAGNCGGEWC